MATPSLCLLFIDLEQFPLGSVLVVMTRKLLQGLSDHQSIGLVEFRDGGKRSVSTELSGRCRFFLQEERKLGISALFSRTILDALSVIEMGYFPAALQLLELF